MNKRLLPLLIMIIGYAPVAVAWQGADPSVRKDGQSAPSKKATTSQISTADKKAEDCGCDEKPPTGVLALVNGVKITIKEVEERVKDTINDLHRQVVEARKRELDLRINTKLLESEAKKRSVNSTKLIDQEVISKVKEPTEAEARAFYDQRKSQIQGEFSSVKGDLIDYLRNQRQGEQAKKLADSLRAAAEVKVLVNSITPPENESDRARVLATVNGERITSGEVEDNLRTIIFNIQEQVYSLRKRNLDLKINDVLLEQEAQKRKVTTSALLEAEVGPKLKKVTEEDTRAFYEQNKEKFTGNYDQLKGRIIQHLQQRAKHDAEVAFAGQLRGAASIQIFLTAPEPPVYVIATDDQPSKGREGAPVTIVEFTDYECPSCAKTHPIIEELIKEYAGKVHWVVRDFPLENHPNAYQAAEAAEAAREQGKYWEYINLLFQNQTALSADKLKEYAGQLGLNRARFDAALGSGKFADRVQRDLQEGAKLGINSTPAVFVNGRRVAEKNRESLKAAIESALKNGAGK
jgi:protein-disulfide isomerase